jgi:hypothetical protein
MNELRHKVDFLMHNTVPKTLYLKFNDKTAVFKFDSIIEGTSIKLIISTFLRRASI